MSPRSMILLLTIAASLAFLGAGFASAGTADSPATAQAADSSAVNPSSAVSEQAADSEPPGAAPGQHER